MAKRASSRKKKAKARSAKAGTFSQAMTALRGANVPRTEFGRFNEDGTPDINQEALEKVKSKLGETAWRKVRFVALNAPFKRQSPTSRV
jgi:hypothetical protein